MEITFLGTSQAIPTKSRNHTANLLRYESENILIDCGEGTQRQFRISGENPCKLTKLLITHWHGDHVLGIPGLIQTLALNNYSRTLHIYGPKNTKQYMERILGMFLFREKIKILVHEIGEGKFYENGFSLTAYKMEHTGPCLAYSFEEKAKRKIDMKKIKKLGIKGPLIGKLQRGENIVVEGKKILSDKVTYLKPGKKVSFIFDTKLNPNCIKAAKNSDILVCEAVYLDELKEKASEYKHLTASQAGEIAKKSSAKKLFLTHLSQRYEKNEDAILKEAKKKFPTAVLAQDLMKIEV